MSEPTPSAPGPIVVVGAGMAGLGTALTLLRGGRDVVVLERLPVVGGLARTVAFGDHIFDVGPHYFFLDVSDEVNALVKSCVTEEEWRPIDFKISAHIGKHHVPWPPTLEAIRKLPPSGMFSYLLNSFKGTLPDSYIAADFLQTVYGRVMYRIFLGPYLAKKVPTSGGAEALHRDWYNQTARTLDNAPDVVRDKILQVEPKLVKAFMARYPETVRRLNEEREAREGNDEADTRPTGMKRAWQIVSGLARSVTSKTFKKVLYPPGGVGVITERLAEHFEAEGGSLNLKAANVELEHEGHRVTRVSWDGGSVENPAEVIWTGSVHRLCSLMHVEREELPFMTIVLGFMKLKRPLPESDILYTYIAADDIIFNRVYYPTRSVPGLCPPGKDSLCIEITPPDQSQRAIGQETIEKVYYGLEKLGICTRDDIEDIEFMWVPDSYPVYPLDYREKLERIWEGLDKFENLRSIGRSGQFWYNNMARSMRVGIETARDLLGEYER